MNFSFNFHADLGNIYSGEKTVGLGKRLNEVKSTSGRECDYGIIWRFSMDSLGFRKLLECGRMEDRYNKIGGMKEDKRLQLGDLIDLRGLEKPKEGVLTVELGGVDGEPAVVERLRRSVGGFAEKMENNQNVRVGEVAELVAAMNNALKRELSPERAAKLLAILKKRFLNERTFLMVLKLAIFDEKRHYRKAEEIKWEDVQAKLEANPEKLWSLNEMEKTGGEPDVTDYDPITGEFIFMDCSAESPKGRRDCVYDREAEEYLRSLEVLQRFGKAGKCHGNAVSRAILMGVNLLTKNEYLELQTKGEFDRHSWSWLETPVDIRADGNAQFGGRRPDGVGGVFDMFVRFAFSHDDNKGFRTSLRV